MAQLGNRCGHPSCRQRLTLADDKPDAGWAVVTVHRYGKKADRMTTFVLCPVHALAVTDRKRAPSPDPRQMNLFASDPDRDPNAYRNW